MYKILIFSLFIVACSPTKEKQYIVVIESNAPNGELRILYDSFFAGSDISAYDTASKKYYTRLYAYKWSIRDAGTTTLSIPLQFDIRSIEGKSILDSIPYVDRNNIDSTYSRFIDAQLSSR